MIEAGEICVCEVCGHRWLAGDSVPGRCARSACKSRGWNARGKVDEAISPRAALGRARTKIESLEADVASLKRELAKRPALAPGGSGKSIEDVAGSVSVKVGKLKATGARSSRSPESNQTAVRSMCRHRLFFCRECHA